MPHPRKAQISLSDTVYYHCISRCVRRAYLCGDDPVSGKSFSHRRKWVESKLLVLPTIFAIGVCAFSVMSNHCHVVLKVQPQKAQKWTPEEVLLRWHKAFRGTILTEKYLKQQYLSAAELNTVMETIAVYRQRLASISWFMRVLNEHIARAANKEDGCTGRFWEGRFKCHALLDEAALLTCMAYVDLNPVRAREAKSLETSAYTSINLRLKHGTGLMQPKSVLPLLTGNDSDVEDCLPFKLIDYVALVDSTSRCIIDGKGFVKNGELNILKQQNIAVVNWLRMSQNLFRFFKGAIGSPDRISQFCYRKEKKRRPGINQSKLLFG